MKLQCKTCLVVKPYEDFSKDMYGIRLINQCWNCKYLTYSYLKEDRKHVSCYRKCYVCLKYFELTYKNKRYCPECKPTLKDWQTSGREIVRQRVRARDNNTCQYCNKKWREGERKLDVHHIYEMKASKKYDNEEDMNKLITLCHKCHVNLHYKYGNGNRMGQIPPSVFGIINRKIVVKCGC